jgi:hypothetical protein
VLNTNVIWFIVGIILLLAIIAIVGYLSNLRRRGKNTRKRGKQTKAVSSGAAKAQHAKEPTSAKDKEDALLRELLALDKAFESGKISKHVYNERRARTKARLRSLLSEQEATRR